MYYHGSTSLFSNEDMLEAQEDGYVQNIWDTKLEVLFEHFRPDDAVSRNEAVFLAGSPDDIDALGGMTDYIYEVDVEDEPVKCDLAWYTEAEKHLENGDTRKAEDCAKNYWSGVEHPKHSCFEFLVDIGWVVSLCDDYD